MNTKYELTDDGRVRALRDFGSVRAGDVGGYVAGEHNLSHEGLCWVADDAHVYGHARISDHAQVRGYAVVSGDAHVYGHAEVDGEAEVAAEAEVYGDARVSGDAYVAGRVDGHMSVTTYGVRIN